MVHLEFKEKKMAVTYDFTPKANAGLASVGGNNVVGVLESFVQLKAIVVTVRSTSNGNNTAVDLRAADGVHGSLYDLILRELQPLMVFAADAGTGVIHAIVDGHAIDAATLERRLAQLSGVGTDTDVTIGTSITVA